MPTTIPEALLRPVDHVDPTASIVLTAFALAVWLTLLGTALALKLRYMRRAARARAAFDPNARLEPGEAILLGEVEHARGEEVAVRVEVTQDGTEAESSGSWSHSWTERDRKVRVRPFYLRHASGQRIRVEPPERVLLVDDMDGCIRVNLAERVRIAELTPGEKVFAHGALTPSTDPEARPGGHGYRDAVFGLVLRPLRGGEMLLSSRPLGEPYERRAGRHEVAAWLLGILLAGLVVVHGSYLLRCAAGERSAGAIVEKKVIEHKDDDGTSYYYRLWIALDGSKDVLTEDVKQSLYRRLEVGQRLPLVLVRFWLARSQLGARPTVALAAPLVALILAFIAFMFYTISARQTIGWWEGPLEEGGSGKLSESN